MIKNLLLRLLAWVDVAPAPAPVTPPPARKGISPTALQRARATRRFDAKEIFAPSKPAPGVLPESTMAFDYAATGLEGWAGGYEYEGADVTSWLGFPLLSALSQRQEYRMVVECFASEMTREWIEFFSVSKDRGKDDQIKELEEEITRLRVRDVIHDAITKDGYFGRVHIYVDLGNTDDAELKTALVLNSAKIKKGSLRPFRIIEPIWTYPAQYNADRPLLPTFYKPSSWYVMAQEVHETRLITMIGRPVPDILKPKYQFGGIALTQLIRPYIDNWLRTMQSVSDKVHNFSTRGIKTNMQSVLEEGAEGDSLFARMDLFNNLADNRGMMALDKDTEDFFDVATPLGTLDKLEAQSQEHVAGFANIPLIILFKITPSGLNSSSEGEMEVWRDTIKGQQERDLRDPLTYMTHLAQVNIWGKIDPDIGFNFVPLKQVPPAEAAAMRKMEADTDAIYIDRGVIDPGESRERVANEVGSPYPGLDVNKVIEPPGMLEAEPDPEGAADAMPVRAAGVLVSYGMPGRMLLLNRADGEGWALPAGRIEEGESPEAAAVRELREETGLDVAGADLAPLGRERARGVDFSAFFAPLPASEAPPVTLCAESLGYGWFTIQEARALRLHPGMVSVLNALEGG